MSEVLDKIESRRSIRHYKDTMVPRELIDKIIRAGLYAASGKNRQDCIIISVTNRAMRDRIMEMNRQIGGYAADVDPFYGAPAMLIVLAKKDEPNHVYDGSLVMGNLMLAAHDLGLGSCWIHRARQEFETEEGRQILADLGIEGEWEGIGHCALGYIDGENPAPLPRKPNRVFYIE
ncbi:MAG: nitroreductase [Bacteroidales bacterium]|nr:nitroreductase [Bacteroidales bacterium]